MRLGILAVVTLALALTACSKVTHENYQKIKAGMTFDEVKGILGNPDKCSDALGMKSCVWGDEKRHITVGFLGDKVALTAAENIR
jgi:hypothetical protein